MGWRRFFFVGVLAVYVVVTVANMQSLSENRPASKAALVQTSQAPTTDSDGAGARGASGAADSVRPSQPAPPAPKITSSPPPPAPVEEDEGWTPARPVAKEGRRVWVLVYATHGGRDDKFCRSLRSLALHNIPVTILGWGEPWQGLHQKLKGVASFLGRDSTVMREDDVVLFADAFDVIFRHDPGADFEAQVLQRFDALNSSLVFAGERGCWPYLDGRPEGPHLCENVYPKATAGSPYRFLNSGVWAGRLSVARSFFERLDAALSADANANDQEMVTDIFVHEPGRGGIVLDYANSLFQCVHMSWNDIEFGNDGTLRNKLTKGEPIALHFNGGAKGQLNKFDSRIVHARLDAMGIGVSDIPYDSWHARVYNDGTGYRSIPFRTLCPSVGLG